MTMPLTETIRAYLGWCPAARHVQASLPAHPEFRTDDVPGGPGGPDGRAATDAGWRSRYHNQVLVPAVVLSAASATALLLIEETPGYPIVSTAIAIGVGSAIGFLISYQKWFGRVAAGEFVRIRGTGRQQIVRRVRALALSMPAFFVVLIAGVVGFALYGTVGQAPAFLLGGSLICWEQYCFTLIWERQHRAVLIAERGSLYTIETAVRAEEEAV
ncbi:DUF1673 family protein [Methanoculleus frigidifontis]|nr:DUF1673 family protein [Methanoculleus sp. FWC-SCC1]